MTADAMAPGVHDRRTRKDFNELHHIGANQYKYILCVQN